MLKSPSSTPSRNVDQRIGCLSEANLEQLSLSVHQTSQERHTEDWVIQQRRSQSSHAAIDDLEASIRTHPANFGCVLRPEDRSGMVWSDTSVAGVFTSPEHTGSENTQVSPKQESSTAQFLAADREKCLAEPLPFGENEANVGISPTAAPFNAARLLSKVFGVNKEHEDDIHAAGPSHGTAGQPNMLRDTSNILRRPGYLERNSFAVDKKAGESKRKYGEHLLHSPLEPRSPLLRAKLESARQEQRPHNPLRRYGEQAFLLSKELTPR